MDRIKKDKNLNPIAKLHIIYGSIIMFLCLAFTITLMTMQSSYKNNSAQVAEMPSATTGEMQPPPSEATTNAGMPSGGAAGMPPFVKKMVQGYKDAIAKNPKDMKALMGLANMYYDSGQYPKAIDFYEKAIEVEPKNANLRADLGTSYFYSGKHDKAIENLKIAIENDPKNLNARYNLGIVYKDQGKKDDAKKEWEAMKPYLTTDEEKKKLDSVIEKLK